MIIAPAISSPNLSKLATELTRLRHSAKRLAERFEESVQLMRESGLPLSAELIEELQDYRNDVCQLSRELALDSPDRGPRRGLSPVDTSSDNASAFSFDDLQSRLDTLRRSEVAEEIRSRLSQLTHVGEVEFAPLVNCLQLATRLCELSKGPIGEKESRDFELLEQNRHPLNSIVRLAANNHELTDSEWSDCCENVAAAFGQPLATALKRGRIQKLNGDIADATTARNVTPCPVAVPPNNSDDSIAQRAESIVSDVRSLAELTKSEPIPAMLSRDPDSAEDEAEESLSIFDSPAAPKSAGDHLSTKSTPAPIARRLSPLSAAAASVLDSTPIPAQPARSFAATVVTTPIEPVRDFSAQPAETNGPRAVRIADHMIRLMADDRLPLAQQLARCLEAAPDASLWTPPSWLLRAVALGRHLSYARGQVTRQLDEELRNFRPEHLTEGSAEQRTVMGFLLRAATVPAALLAGSAPATSILRSFKIDPELTQLYNYCSRIGTYGNRLAGTLAEMFRPTGTIAGASELEDVAQAARLWLQTAVKKTLSYSRSSPLFLHAHWTVVPGTAMRHADITAIWRQWQQTLLTAKRLLDPVYQGLDGERNSVRKEIVRLTSRLRVAKPGLTAKGASVSDELDLAMLSPEMQATLDEAIKIANRWLQVCDQAGPGGASPIPPEALEMRSEILNRSSAVLLELVQHRRSVKSPLVHAAIACCQSNIRYLQSVFESKTALPAMELDPRRIFNADLLRFPGLELNDQWLPINDPSVIEFELLSGLEHGELSWRQSFDVHAQAGQHVATGRLLELDVWENSVEHESLMTLRNAQIRAGRSILEAELNAIANRFQQAADAAGYSSAFRAVHLQRLDVLRNELPRVLDFAAFRRRLDQWNVAPNRVTAPDAAVSGPAASSARSATEVRRATPIDAPANRETPQKQLSAHPESSTVVNWDVRPSEAEGLYLSYDGEAPGQLMLSSADIYSGE